MRRILVVYGTRPEAIKMAPLILELQRSAHIQPIIAVTGQHRDMLDQVNSLFGIHPDHDLNIITDRQTLEGVTTKVLAGLSSVIASEHPDAMLVQGDTTTCFAGALSAFYGKVPVVHLEAGLRTRDLYNPFPEEANRRLTSQLAALHLAPTAGSKSNLIADGVSKSNIVITGNSVIDALLLVESRNLPFENRELEFTVGRKTVLVTMHRRESWGRPMAQAAEAVASLARRFDDYVFILPAHLNPAVREVLLPPLAGLENILVTEPLGYGDFVRVMRGCTLVLTDSGGVQEEAPAFGKPVLVLRETTERPEAVDAGTVKLVGTDEARIVGEATRLITDHRAYQTMARSMNPYGDGHAAARSVRAIEHLFGLGATPVEFTYRSQERSDLVPDPSGVVDHFAA